MPQAFAGYQAPQQVRLPAGQPRLLGPATGRAGRPVSWPRVAVGSAAAVVAPFRAAVRGGPEILFGQAARLGTEVVGQHRIAGQFEAGRHQVVIDLRVGGTRPRGAVLGPDTQRAGPFCVRAQQVADVVDEHAAQLGG